MRQRPLAYRRYWLMRARCENPRNNRFRLYGARGITVCAEWRADYAAFLRDMGPCPSRAHSLDRIDPDGNYEPGNCRWATATEQARNHRNARLLTHDGQTRCLAEWAEHVGLSTGTLWYRLRAGWPLALALSAPLGAVRHEIPVEVRRAAGRAGARARWHPSSSVSRHPS